MEDCIKVVSKIPISNHVSCANLPAVGPKNF